MSDPIDAPADATHGRAGALRAHRFRLIQGDAIAELDLCERPEAPASPDLELALMAPGLRTRVVAAVPRARLLRFATALAELRSGRGTLASLHITGASEVGLRVRATADGPRLSIHGRQFGEYSVRVALRDLPLDPLAFRQLLDWAADLRR